MPTRTVTIDSLIAEYAAPIANTAGIDPNTYDHTPGGLATLIRDTADKRSGFYGQQQG